MARPIPCPAPVTRATCPDSSLDGSMVRSGRACARVKGPPQPAWTAGRNRALRTPGDLPHWQRVTVLGGTGTQRRPVPLGASACAEPSGLPDELAVLPPESLAAPLPVKLDRLLGSGEIARRELDEERPVVRQRFVHGVEVAGVLDLDDLGLTQQRVVQAGEPRAPAARHQQAVELVVRHPVRGDVPGARSPARRPRDTVAADPGRAGGSRPPFNRNANTSSPERTATRSSRSSADSRADTRAPPRRELDQPLGSQHLERFAHGRHADAQFVRQSGGIETVAGLVARDEREDPVPESLRDQLGERPADLLDRSRHAGKPLVSRRRVHTGSSGR